MAKAVDIMPDGTLVVKTRHYEDVKRVLVEHGTSGTLFYADERPKGHWIYTGDYYTGAYDSVDYVKCSCCNEDSLEEGNFCPNCGADMREGRRMRLIDADEILKEINELKESPWFNEGKELMTVSYIARKEAVEIIEDLCIKNNQQLKKDQKENDYNINIRRVEKRLVLQ